MLYNIFTIQYENNALTLHFLVAKLLHNILLVCSLVIDFLIDNHSIEL